MKRFNYKNATTTANAVALLKDSTAAVLAGGTDLLNQLKTGAIARAPEALVNIKNIPGLDSISQNGQGLKIGALVKLSDIAAAPMVRERYPLLAAAAQAVASPPIRQMATIGGNLCQETQCWYFRRSFLTGTSFDCFRKGKPQCIAVTGKNRFHSIFGGIRLESSPCSKRCPAHTDIPAYLDKIRDGDLAEAAAMLLEANPFPAITGRVCPHFCESECNRSDYDAAVSIRSIERFLGDYILDNADKLAVLPRRETGKKVAIVGSGPAGLSAAYYLRQLGYGVTIFETMPLAGGTLALSIPNYRLPDEVLQKSIGFIQGLGVEIKTNAPIGRETTVPDLLKQGHAAAFIAVGAGEGRKLPIPGADLAGTLVGLDFLRDVKLGKPVKLGARVLVLGGGSVASDCARTALRRGAKEVHMACLESRRAMPADPLEIKEAEEEGVVLHPALTFTRIVGSRGRASGVECLKVLWMRFSEEGGLEMETAPDSVHLIPADTVIFAIGQAPDLSVLAGIEGLTITRRKTLAIDPETLATGVSGIFAGGDVVTMRGSVIEAIAVGKKAAASIDRYLGGQGMLSEDGGQGSKFPCKFNSAFVRKTSRVDAPHLPAAERLQNIEAECIGDLPLSAIAGEASRCFNCGCLAVNSSDMAPALIALNARIKTTRRTIEAEKLFTVECGKTTVLDADEIITGIHVPAPPPGTKQAFIKFALRPTIDFAVASVAAAITTKAGKVSAARIVLGAVAPVPYRAVEAERALLGKAITETAAETAAAAAVRSAVPLTHNKYKMQIARTLVKRAILA